MRLMLQPLAAICGSLAPLLLAGTLHALQPGPIGSGGGGGSGGSGGGVVVAPVASDVDREVAAATRAALEVLGPRVKTTSRAGALETAFRAYFRYRAAHPKTVRKPYLFFVDFGLDNRTPRGWVLDMDALRVVEGPFTVAHGSGSGARNGVPSRFSNRSGSLMSSVGLYLAQETYAFRGKSGGRPYRSVGLRMRGESGRFNSAARSRGIVAHGAPYVTSSDAGRSSGCPAMEPERARRLLPMIADGGVVLIYSPHAADWLREGPWARAGASGGRPADG